MTDPRRTLHGLENLPSIGGSVDFWANGTQYLIDADQVDAWALSKNIGGKWRRVLEFGTDQDGRLQIFDERLGPIPAGTESWQALVGRHL